MTAEKSGLARGGNSTKFKALDTNVAELFDPNFVQAGRWGARHPRQPPRNDGD